MDSQGVRELCNEITQEHDIAKTSSLLAQLRETLTVQYDEARLRIAELAKRYHEHLEH
ncbi:MAG TPA: hypothetical protein VH088_24510 [Terriglobales bacterium]|jgi:hypothetical protein|nr:hypothetical protein [Terriglobales bacterium]